MKKTRLFASCALIMGALSLVACGSSTTTTTAASETTTVAAEETTTTVAAVAIDGTTITTNLFELVYDEADGWTYEEEDDLYDTDSWSNLYLRILGDDDVAIVSAYIDVSIEEPYTFRDDLISYGFDQYEYAENNAYELTTVGGVDLLTYEDSYWGSDVIRYFNRIEGAGATVAINISGDVDDERVAKLLAGLTINLEDTGNVDGPWEWEGEPFATTTEHSYMVGTYTLNSVWLPADEPIVTTETFNHSVAVVGSQAYMLSDGVLKLYDYDGTSLTYVEDIELPDDYEDKVQADVNGNIWLADFTLPLISMKDGVQTASYEGPDYIAMDPTGTWGISYFTSPECEKITLSDGAITTQPITFAEVDMVSRVFIDENYIYVCGSAADDSGHKVFIYDTDGNLVLTLADADGSGLGSITFIAQTSNGFIGLDGNMREVVLWKSDGTYIGAADDGDLFGTSYPWFCSASMLDDGSILCVMTQEREDRSADEVIAFRLSGF